ncbi:MAG: hypothetical protein ORN57_04010 [Alphaproteobacteria bacterium]|nr:hypothetical protein [Alphaproteobacteria bacterium]
MKSALFYSDEYKNLEKNIYNFLRNQTKEDILLSPRTLQSTRAVGDAIADLLAENLGAILGPSIKSYEKKFARRAMADMAFTDKYGCYYVVDVKTHRLDTKFNMPNLISVKRLTDFYKDDKNYFVILKIDYDLNQDRINIKSVSFNPIEMMAWSCLTIGALGWGQIQIANSNQIVLNNTFDRKQWMLEFFDKILDFYPEEVKKIKNRIDYFAHAKNRWNSK